MSASTVARAAVEVQAGEDSPVLALQLRQLMKELTPQDQRTIEQVDLTLTKLSCIQEPGADCAREHMEFA